MTYLEVKGDSAIPARESRVRKAASIVRDVVLVNADALGEREGSQFVSDNLGPYWVAHRP